jgi:hypothetical protein
MNNILDVASHFIYIALSIILLPVFVTLDIVLGVWIASRFIKRTSRKMARRIRDKQPSYQLAFRKSVHSLRGKLAGVPVNSQH